MNTYTDPTYERLLEQAKELKQLAQEVKRQQFQRLRDAGWTMQKIGDKYGGLTRQRVEQILKGRE